MVVTLTANYLMNGRITRNICYRKLQIEILFVSGGALIFGRIVLCTFLRFHWLGGGGWGRGTLTFLELAHATHAMVLRAHSLYATPMLTFLELAHATYAMVLRAHALHATPILTFHELAHATHAMVLAVGLPCAKHMVSEISMLNIISLSLPKSFQM